MIKKTKKIREQYKGLKGPGENEDQNAISRERKEAVHNAKEKLSAPPFPKRESALQHNGEG